MTVNHQPSTMVSKKHYKAEEVTVLAKAFAIASQDPIVGADQRSEDLAKKIHLKVKELAPANCDAGTYHHRTPDGIWGFLRDTVLKDVQAFNKSLRLVYLSEPSGVSEEDKINMAVAIHKSKVERMEYRFKDYEARDWKCYDAWNVLKGHRKFLPPQQPIQEEPPQVNDVGWRC